MSRAIIEETSLTAIGNAIRTKTGGTELLSVPTGMVNAINGITTGGEMKVACFTGYTDGNNKVFENIANTIPNFDLNNCLIFYATFTGASNTYRKCAYYKGHAYEANGDTISTEYSSYYSYQDAVVNMYGDFSGILGSNDDDMVVTYDATTNNGTLTFNNSLVHTYIKILYIG